MKEGGAVVGEDKRRGPAMTTFSGTSFYLEDPLPDEVNIIDIAHALGHQGRYTGHCLFYSVAEHSVLVSHMVPEKDQLAGLFHDATEAYVADLSRPVKRALGKDNTYFGIESDVWSVIAVKFGLKYELPESVKIADLAICGLEREVLHPRAPEWDIPYPIPRHLTIQAYPPTSAPQRFLRRYTELTGESFAALLDQYGDMIDQNAKLLTRHRYRVRDPIVDLVTKERA